MTDKNKKKVSDKKKVVKSKSSKLPKGKVVSQFKFRFNLGKILVWGLVLFLFLPTIASFFADGFLKGVEIPLSQAIGDIKDKKVEKVEVRGDDLVFYYSADSADKPEMKLSRKEEGTSFVEVLQREDINPSSVKIEVMSQFVSKAFFGIISIVLPVLLFGGLLYFMMRKRGGGMGMDMFGMGKSKAKLFAKGKQNVTFADVAGVDEAKEELEEVVDFLKFPKKYRQIGARTPKGALLIGPSGVGKTLLARAIAGEASVPFFSMAGSEFMEMLVGVGASRVRDLFETAKKASPSIIFIDEIDAIGRTRGMGGAVGGHDEREQTLNQILVEMDGFSQNDNVVVLAATNRPDVLDPALVRPGRFDRRVTLDLPDIEGRKDILSIYSKGKPFEEGVDWDMVSKRTVGFSGADLENMLNEAAIRAARKGRTKIASADVEEAALRVKLGPEKKRLQTERERKLTAYHEAGHAVASHFLSGADPVHRVSIVSRGMALGFTLSQPDRDKYSNTEHELRDLIAVMMGGRAAEKIVFNEMTGGASSDIEKATRIARAMVVELGMSRLGPVALGPMWDRDSWGKGYVMEPAKVAESTQSKVDEEIRRLVDDGYKKAVKIIKKHKKQMDKLVDQLMKTETVEQEEFVKIMGSKNVEVK
jgi:cell division protease FtsH